MKISRNGLSLIAKFEGLRFKPYRDCAGLWTVGIGHLIGDGRSLPDSWNKTFTLDECYALLAQDVTRFEFGLARYINIKLTQNQFDALCSLAFNIGLGRVQRSPLRQKLNRGDIKGCVKEWAKYVKAGGKVYNGLVARRKAEIALFLS